ncbi:MAG: Methyltransferase, FkbM family [candidate division TM6 bacterium GW2011_GWF2_28_16]|nr:MAG: Methyltransferase, FkbM family [candidate division TM6 bacterium GW2011_GWF2_28_16]
MKLKNIFLLIIAIISFLSITLTVYIYKKYPIKYIGLTSIFAIKNTYLNKNINNFYSNKDLLLAHFKILKNINKQFYNNVASENILDFKVNYSSHYMLHALFNEIFLNKIYYLQINNPEPHIIDCGANIGMATIFFKKIYPNAKIIAFEPSKQNFDLLQKNILDNKLNNIELINKALYNKTGTFYLQSAGTLQGSLINKKINNNDEAIETTTLSQFINNKIDLLKIDIEGCETLVMQELNENKKLSFIDNMIIEYHPEKHNNKLSDLLKILEINNFKFHINSNIKTPFSKVTDELNLIYAYKI